jgi:hypothetical protein
VLAQEVMEALFSNHVARERGGEKGSGDHDQEEKF